MDKNWNYLGKVTIKTAGSIGWRDTGPQTLEFPCIEAAVRWYGYNRCMNLKKGHLGWQYTSTYFNNRLNETWHGGDGAIFICEFGMVIPPWKVKEVANYACDAYDKGHRYRRWRGSRFKFRDGPVEGIGTCRRHRGTYYRRIKTSQELRENDFLFYDEDAQEHGITPRPSRRRGNNLPTAWDDICHSKSRWAKDWKTQRKTQWKGSGST